MLPVAGASTSPRGGQGRPWGGAAYNVAGSALRTFGEYLRIAGHRAENPLADLRAAKKRSVQGARPLTVDEAKALIAASIERHWSTGYGKGNPPLFYAVCLLTGLRHAEASAMTWECVDLDSPMPGILTAEGWSKSGRQDWIAMPAQLVEVLRPYREMVPHARGDRVFTHIPAKNVLAKDVGLAGIKDRPTDGYVAFHSFRKSFKTWLGGAGVPGKIVDYLSRHKSASEDGAYNRPFREELVPWADKLPRILPEGGKPWYAPKKN